ncbi:hypothetical protein [Pseudomonas gingeri]|uniref:hypothetical protein n=1 Tax=Pseudomonas gingeri TaxID=117681 RepID=UPI0015A0F839|nr:hypothetical protein [Pseudomonas gingeri]NWA01199.1 hypothetical protein [Pseudomonas gingeri]NWB32255.1 hypothetical protein [Pseudomonas gingeri]NWE24282.1 hypothetical protein [Pseudomonas gingeri]NWE97979.1 hypothetical protein [Pseudomonas gingeri]
MPARASSELSPGYLQKGFPPGYESQRQKVECNNDGVDTSCGSAFTFNLVARLSKWAVNSSRSVGHFLLRNGLFVVMLLGDLPAQCHRSLLNQLQQVTTFAHQQVGGIGDMGEVFVAGGVEADAGHGLQQVAGGLEASAGQRKARRFGC